jgi:hypothetical protein
VQLVCIVIPNVVLVVPNPLINVMPGLNIFQQYFRETLIMLDVIRSEFCDESQTHPKVLANHE